VEVSAGHLAVQSSLQLSGARQMTKNPAKKRSNTASRFVKTQCLIPIGKVYGVAAGTPA
jgi:hypothetical protein